MNTQRNNVVCALLSLVLTVFSAQGMGDSAALFEIDKENDPCGLDNKLIGRTVTIKNNGIQITVAYEPRANLSDGEQHGVLLADCDCVGVLVTPDKQYYHEYYGNIFRAQNVQVPDSLDESGSCEEGDRLRVGTSKSIRTLHLRIPNFREEREYRKVDFRQLFYAYWKGIFTVEGSNSSCNSNKIEKIAFCFPSAHSDVLRKTVAKIIISSFLCSSNHLLSPLHNQPNEIVVVAFDENEFDYLTEALTYCNGLRASLYTSREVLIDSLFQKYQRSLSNYQQSLSNSDCKAENALSSSDCKAENALSGTSKAYWYQWPVWLKCTGFIGCGGLLAFAGWKLYQRGYFNAIAHWFRS